MLKQQMRVINGATMTGSAACLSQFDEEKDFNNSSFAKPFKYGNMALQIGIGAALLKDGLGKRKIPPMALTKTTTRPPRDV